MICARDGCRAYALTGDQFCFSHSQSPDIVQKRNAARSRGGSRGKLDQSLDIQSIEDVRRVLSETVSELRSTASENIVSKSRSIGYICSILLTALEKSDLESRVSALEKTISETT